MTKHNNRSLPDDDVSAKMQPLGLGLFGYLLWKTFGSDFDNIIESSLAEPIIDILRREFGHQVKREARHPAFSSSGLGAKRSIDYVVERFDPSSGDHHIDIALETKWITKRDFTEEILFDVLRLQHLAVTSRGRTACFLLLAGPRKPYFTKFRNVKINTIKSRKKFRPLIFNISAKPKNITVSSLPERLRDSLTAFETTYNCKLHKHFTTTKVFSINSKNICLAIWQIAQD